MPRRDFLGLAAIWSAVATLAFALLGIARLPRAAIVPVPSRKFRVALPESLPPGEPYTLPGRAVALFRDAGGVYAISRVCTHLGCIVSAQPNGFHCPCHGSRFALDGSVLKGPAPRALPWIAVSRAGEGTYWVDEGKTVPQGTRVAS